LFLRARRLRGEGRGARGVAECAVFVAVVVGAWWWSATSPAFANTRNWDWKPFETPAAATGEVLLNATNQHEALWLLSIVIVIGACTVRRFPALRWVLAGHVTVGVLYLIAAGLNRPDTRVFTGYWYNDAHRIAAMLPITGVPLAIAGILVLVGALRARVPAVNRLATGPVVAAALTALLVVATGGLYPTDREIRVSPAYPRVEEYKMVTDRMRVFYDRIAQRIPEDSVVIGNPFDGSVMLWALTGRKVLYPHLLVEESAEQEYLGRNLSKAATDPRVCQALARYNVEYALLGRDNPQIAAITPYEGIAGIPYGEGFELVDRAGPTRLYRITACDS
jgi:hypothetical protein